MTNKPVSHRLNVRLTATDRLTIDRIQGRVAASISTTIKLAINTSYVLVQFAAETSFRLVLRNDSLRVQQDLNLLLLKDASLLQTNETSGPVSNHDVVQVRLQ